MKRFLVGLIALVVLLLSAHLAVEYYEYSHPPRLPQTQPDAFIGTTLIRSTGTTYRSQAFHPTVYLHLVRGRVSLHFTGLVEREILFPPEIVTELQHLLSSYRETHHLASYQRIAIEKDLGGISFVDESGRINPVSFQFRSSFSDGYVFRRLSSGLELVLPFSLEPESTEPSTIYLPEDAIEKLDSLIDGLRAKLEQQKQTTRA